MKVNATCETSPQPRPTPRLIPPIYFLFTLGLMTLLHLLVPIATWCPPPWNLAGVLPIAAGLTLIFTAATQFRRRGTAIKPFEPTTTLVTDGIYRFTRNPMYLGLTLILAGAAIGFGTLSPILPIPLFVACITTRFIKKEEALLTAQFGDAYRDYTRRVRRWL